MGLEIVTDRNKNRKEQVGRRKGGRGRQGTEQYLIKLKQDNIFKSRVSFRNGLSICYVESVPRSSAAREGILRDLSRDLPRSEFHR